MKLIKVGDKVFELNDDRLSPMTYSKLKEMGYTSEDWKDWDQEHANKVVAQGKKEGNSPKSKKETTRSSRSTGSSQKMSIDEVKNKKWTTEDLKPYQSKKFILQSLTGKDSKYYEDFYDTLTRDVYRSYGDITRKYSDLRDELQEKMADLEDKGANTYGNRPIDIELQNLWEQHARNDAEWDNALDAYDTVESIRQNYFDIYDDYEDEIKKAQSKSSRGTKQREDVPDKPNESSGKANEQSTSSELASMLNKLPKETQSELFNLLKKMQEPSNQSTPSEQQENSSEEADWDEREANFELDKSNKRSLQNYANRFDYDIDEVISSVKRNYVEGGMSIEEAVEEVKELMASGEDLF